ncbi:MAG: O-methyltransferase [Rickettsiales bacterium]|nr:O-methyltransferase [Rickettsiales bacterium]
MRADQTAIDHYIHETFAPEDALLKSIREVGERLHPGMQVSPYEGKMLQVFLQMIGAKRVLEIGSFVGYSTVCMARALPADGALISLEFNREHADYAAQHTSDFPQVEIRQGDALQLIPDVEGPLDAIFIDAEKRSYLKYLAAALPKLRKGGLVMADNSLLFGAMVGEPKIKVSEEATEVMRQLNLKLANDEVFCGIMIPTIEGLTIAVKR